VCATRFRNPDTNACVTPADVHWIEGRGLPNGATVGRNTLFTKGVNNFDMNILKSFSITESKRLEYRLEAFNIFNQPMYVNVPGLSVVGTPGPASPGQPSRFLNQDFTNNCVGNGCNPRTMRMQLKFII
jgi:hypothetical protein